MADAVPLIRASGLKKYFIRGKKFRGRTETLKAVDGIDLSVYPGQILGLVGESGCGKSTLGRLLIGLHKPTAGSIVVNGGIHIENFRDREMRPLRCTMQIIFQDPYDSLNPRKPVIQSVMDPLGLVSFRSRADKEAAAELMLHKVGLDSSQFRKYPHELSGGQRQRVVIARAMAVDPAFILCDEPVSALDVSIRAQILKLMKRLQEERKMAYLFISHDLSVIRYLCDTVAVMYLGKIIEFGSRSAVFNNPVHPYTQALMSAIPIPDPDIRREQIILKGDIPSPVHIPHGCRFRQRCPHAEAACGFEEPALRACEEEEHRAACFKFAEPGCREFRPAAAAG
jgi:peptide/nickel transport system ATP-binding protein/oligopeptide transport system ATP-binding protein